ncbi:MAG: DUF4386 domain-containing protein [Terracidiphilus sp.]
MDILSSLDRLSTASPRFWARLAGLFYLINTVTSISSFSGMLSGSILSWSNWIATGSYVTVVLLLYVLFLPVSKNLSAIAAAFGLLGCADEALWKYHWFPLHVNSLVFFGFYCGLLALLILRSRFMPRLLGWLLMLACCGWLTFLTPWLASVCSPYNYIAGGIGEIPLMLWLLIMGVRERR